MAKRKGFSWPVTLTLTFVPLLFSAVWLLGLEVLTLTDGTPRNAITTALQQGLADRPHLFVMSLVLVVGVTCFVLGAVLGHAFHDWTGDKAVSRGILARSEDHAVEEFEDALNQRRIAEGGPRK